MSSCLGFLVVGGPQSLELLKRESLLVRCHFWRPANSVEALKQRSTLRNSRHRINEFLFWHITAWNSKLISRVNGRCHNAITTERNGSYCQSSVSFVETAAPGAHCLSQWIYITEMLCVLRCFTKLSADRSQLNMQHTQKKYHVTGYIGL